MSGPRAVRVLAAMASILLCAGLVATQSAAPNTRGDDRVAAAGLASRDIPDETVAHTTVGVSIVATTTSTLATPPGTRPSSTTPSTTPTTRSSTSATTLPGIPLPASAPVTGIPNIPPASSWSTERDGVSARMRIDPVAPVAGQNVRFFLEVSSGDPCCTILLDFGDGSTGFSVNNGAPCGSLPPGAQHATTSHVFASPGAYKATLTVITGLSCPPPLAPGAAPPIPAFHGADLSACIAVGPGTSGQGGCSPFPPFGPDSIISPVLDPFCQVRSDCSQASPPR